MSRFQSVCVYCGSGFGDRPEYREAAFGIGVLLAQRGIRVVYGGAQVGLMGTVAFVGQMTGSGFVRPQHAASLLVESDPVRLLERMEAFQPPVLGKWIEAMAAEVR